MRVLVTGAGGFIGSHVCEKLANDHQVVGVDNFDTYYGVSIKKSNVALFKDKVEFMSGDFTDEAFLETLATKDFDVIIHLGAKAGVRASLENPVAYHKSNIIGTQLLLDFARKSNVKKFVLASSSSVYGERNGGPFKETDSIDFQSSPYAITKRTCEALCHTYAHLYGLSSVCLRFFTVYGPRGRPDMAPLGFMQKIVNDEEITIYGDGSIQRDYTYVADIVDGICAAAFKQTSQFEIFNLGKGKPNTVLELVAALEQAIGKSAKKTFVEQPKADVSLTYADISKAQQLLGYNPSTDLEEGIKLMVNSYK